MAERTAEEALDALGENGGAGEALPPLDNRAVGSNEEGGGELADLELTGEPTIRVEQQGDLKVPVVACVEDDIARGLRGGRRSGAVLECRGGRESRSRGEDRGIDDGDSQPAGAVLIGHAGEEDNLAARRSGGGVGDSLEESEKKRLRGLDA